MSAALPPRRVEPGWYWWLIMPRDQKAWSAFTALNKGALFVRKTMRGQNEINEVAVFEVKTPIAWTLDVPPMRAPKGLRTNLEDLISGPPPSPHWTAALEEILGKPMAKAREASTALSVVLWGGAAILLFNLFQTTRARRAAEVAPALDEPEEEAA